jgi:hypothetical protein
VSVSARTRARVDLDVGVDGYVARGQSSSRYLLGVLSVSAHIIHSRTITGSQADADLVPEAHDPSFPQNHLLRPLPPTRTGQCSRISPGWPRSDLKRRHSRGSRRLLLRAFAYSLTVR